MVFHGQLKVSELVRLSLFEGPEIGDLGQHPLLAKPVQNHVQAGLLGQPGGIQMPKPGICRIGEDEIGVRAENGYRRR